MEDYDKKLIARKVIKTVVMMCASTVSTRLFKITMSPDMGAFERLVFAIGAGAVGTWIGESAGNHLDKTLLTELFGEYPKEEVSEEE